MANKEKLVPITIRVPESYIERLDVLREKFDVDRTEMARRVLRNGLADTEKAAKIAEHPIGEKLLQLCTLLEGSADEREEMSRAIRTIAIAKKTKKKPRTA